MKYRPTIKTNQFHDSNNAFIDPGLLPGTVVYAVHNGSFGVYMQINKEIIRYALSVLLILIELSTPTIGRVTRKSITSENFKVRGLYGYISIAIVWKL